MLLNYMEKILTKHPAGKKGVNISKIKYDIIRKAIINSLEEKQLTFTLLADSVEKMIGKNMVIIKPVGYLDFIWLEKNAKKILTDSGGIQKEAYMLKVPCITLRENTEWIETVKDGWNTLVGTNKEKIIDSIKNFNPSGEQKNYFGNGTGSKQIKKVLEQLKF